MAIFLIMVLVSLVFFAKCVYDDDDGDVYVLLCLKEKNPDIRCISAPGSVTDVNMFHVVSSVKSLFNPPSAVLSARCRRSVS